MFPELYSLLRFFLFWDYIHSQFAPPVSLSHLRELVSLFEFILLVSRVVSLNIFNLSSYPSFLNFATSFVALCWTFMLKVFQYLFLDMGSILVPQTPDVAFQMWFILKLYFNPILIIKCQIEMFNSMPYGGPSPMLT